MLRFWCHTPPNQRRRGGRRRADPREKLRKQLSKLGWGRIAQSIWHLFRPTDRKCRLGAKYTVIQLETASGEALTLRAYGHREIPALPAGFTCRGRQHWTFGTAYHLSGVWMHSAL